MSHITARFPGLIEELEVLLSKHGVTEPLIIVNANDCKHHPITQVQAKPEEGEADEDETHTKVIEPSSPKPQMSSARSKLLNRWRGGK